MAKCRIGALTLLVVCVFMFSMIEESLAYCSEPSFSQIVPDVPGSYSKPDVPYCLSMYSYNGTHTCDDWEIDSYLSGVNEYVRKLQNYAKEASSFADTAIRFANDAIEYANCEVKAAKTQHE